MPSGRIPKPAEMKKLQGNPGRRKLPDLNRPKVNMSGPPKWLDKKGKEFWLEVQTKLERLGFVNETDELAFALLCDAYSGYVAVSNVMKKKGMNGIDERISVLGEQVRQRSPEFLISETYFNRAIKLFDRFGLTPAARGKLGITLDSKDDLDPMAKKFQ